MTRRLILTLFILSLIVAFMPLVSIAQESSGLVAGEPVQGTLDDGRMFEEWPFTVEADQPISLWVRTTSGDLNPVLAILDSDREVVVANDDSRLGEEDARIEGFIRPTNGLYIARVYREGLGQGSTSGDYELLLLKGYGSMPFGQDEGKRIWLSRDNRADQMVLADLPIGNFDATYAVQVTTQATTGYHVAFRLKAPSDAGAGWLFQWENSGRWELALVDSNETLVLNTTGASDWLATPDTELQLEFLLRGRTMSIFMNGDPLGELIAPADIPLSDDPTVSAAINGIERPDGAISLIVGEIVMTQVYYDQASELLAVPPFPSNQRLFSYLERPKLIIEELLKRDIAETDIGGVIAQAQQGYIYTNELGFSAYPLWNDNVYGDFVIGFIGQLTDGPSDTACGIVFRQEDGANFATALFNPNRDLYFLNYDEGQPTGNTVTARTPMLRGGLGAENHFVIAAIGNVGTVYVNGRQMGQIELTAAEGRILVQLVLNEEVNANCLLTGIWLWRFEY